MEHDRRLILSSGFGCLHSVFGFSFTSISQARLSFLHVMNERKKGVYCRYEKFIMLGVVVGSTAFIKNSWQLSLRFVCVCVVVCVFCYIRSIIFGVTKVLFIMGFERNLLVVECGTLCVFG